MARLAQAGAGLDGHRKNTSGSRFPDSLLQWRARVLQNKSWKTAHPSSVHFFCISCVNYCLWPQPDAFMCLAAALLTNKTSKQFCKHTFYLCSLFLRVLELGNSKSPCLSDPYRVPSFGKVRLKFGCSLFLAVREEWMGREVDTCTTILGNNSFWSRYVKGNQG